MSCEHEAAELLSFSMDLGCQIALLIVIQLVFNGPGLSTRDNIAVVPPS